MGLFDKLFVVKPRWTAAEWDTFSKNYDAMAKGVFSWTDFIPPTNLPGVGVKAILLSLKTMVSAGNKGLIAGYVDKMHQCYRDGVNTSDIHATYNVKWTALGYSFNEVFTVVLALHDKVFPGERKD